MVLHGEVSWGKSSLISCRRGSHGPLPTEAQTKPDRGPYVCQRRMRDSSSISWTSKVSQADQPPDELLRAIPGQTFGRGFGHGLLFWPALGGPVPSDCRSGRSGSCPRIGRTPGTGKPFRKPRGRSHRRGQRIPGAEAHWIIWPRYFRNARCSQRCSLMQSTRAGYRRGHVGATWQLVRVRPECAGNRQ